MAGTIDSSSPDLRGVSRCWRKRMSSPLTKMLTNRFTCPDSSQMRSRMPGWRVSRSASGAATVLPSASTASEPPVNLRSGVGTLTWVMTWIPPVGFRIRRSRQSTRGRSRVAAQLRVQRVEVAEARRDAERLLDAVGDGLERLVAVARDADDDGLVARDAALGDQLAGDGDRGAARGLGEDALGARQQLDAVGALRVAGHLAPAARFADGLQPVEAVGRVADGDRLGDRVRLHGADEIGPLVERLDHGRRARGLGAVDGEVAV